MSNVVEMNEFCGVSNAGYRCWLCQKPVSGRLLFCHKCGTIQPVRNVDFFSRLGIERNLDVNIEALEHQYTALSRTLSPERFLIRGMGERGHAAKQLEAVKEAYETLRDPLRRGRYWLALNNKASDVRNSEDDSSVVDLRQELNAAVMPAHCDRVAQKAGQFLEQGVKHLMQSLRVGEWQKAMDALAQIDGVESVLDEARSKRDRLSSGGSRS